MSLKLFGKNAFVYSLANAILRASSFLLIPIYTQFLSLSEYGLLASILLTIQILIKVINVGLLNSLMRFTSDYRDKDILGRYLGSVIFLNLVSGFIVSCIVMLLFQPVFRNVLHIEDVSSYAFFTCLAVVTQSLALNMMSYFRASNEGVKFTLVSISVALALILGNTLFFLLFDLGVLGVLIVQSVIYGSCWLFVSLIIFMKNSFGISPQIMKQLLKFGFPLIFADAGSLLMNTTAVYFLSYFTDLEKVSIYSLALKIAQITTMVLVLPFQLSYEPYVFANTHRKDIRLIISRLTNYLMLAFAFVAFVIVFVFRDLLLVVAPKEYYSAYSIIFFLLPGLAFSGLNYIAQSLLHIKNRTNITGTVVTIISSISILLNYFLIPSWQINAIILVFNFKMISVSMILIWFGIRTFPVKFDIKRLSISVVIFLIFLSATFSLKNTPYFVYYPLLLLVCVSIGVFIFWSDFFTTSEKRIIKKFIRKLKNIIIFKHSRITKSAPV